MLRVALGTNKKHDCEKCTVNYYGFMTLGYSPEYNLEVAYHQV